ncbi:LysM peptidoglycan-binding domain-containing protein [Geodermatophilus obscurus]|uniref:Peptidoglycan-binding lysin domain protein n=1 Tax=Geodermatophilus obscurus (strain ATCC 25078 / DSM 43160 / JCM 3152 / CCUG 61914 / KCC A-0152 / KCTC 9177 / NBRC 13315 / NRRL B-3577 / G-20) TaxID=526225 RepID=D2S454_GEOOG|nr:LysM domain-containing protein [Geodermatophilus obscurus]ADB75044.1 Peptidoglycan-binding lysin domain protein [Geodermatophilus obscurus DSM 43160]
MAKHRAPRYVRTKKVLAKAPVAAGATVVGFGVLSSPAQAFAGTTVLAHAVEVPAATPAANSGTAAPEADHTVEHGDTIAKIAAAHGQSWRELYQRNAGVIGADPNRILPGQVLLTAGSAAAHAAPAAPAPIAGSAGNAAPAAAVAPLAAVAPAPAAAPAPVAAAASAATARITNSAGDVAPQVRAAANRVVSEVPGADSITIGGTRASATDPNGHPSGLALDYMVGSDSALGDAIVAFHIAHWDELGVEYVIWEQRILTSPTGAWKAMADRGSATANHMDHPHVNYVG